MLSYSIICALDYSIMLCSIAIRVIFPFITLRACYILPTTIEQLVWKESGKKQINWKRWLNLQQRPPESTAQAFKHKMPSYLP